MLERDEIIADLDTCPQRDTPTVSLPNAECVCMGEPLALEGRRQSEGGWVSLGQSISVERTRGNRTCSYNLPVADAIDGACDSHGHTQAIAATLISNLDSALLQSVH